MTHGPAGVEAHNRIQRDYYESRAIDKQRRMVPASSRYIAAHVERFLAFAELSSEELILDVGCGMGKFTLPLAERGYRMEGLDLSPMLLGELEAHDAGRFNIPVHCADILTPPPALAGRFDVVTGFFMLHHLLNLDASFAKMRQFLRGGGRVAFLDVNPLCPLYYLQIALTPSMSWKAERGMLNLTRKKLTAGLASAGFKNIRIERGGILPPQLKNRRIGEPLDRLFTRSALLNPVAAFQLISAGAA